MLDPLSTVISQYANSPRICGLVQRWNACLDPSANITAFYDDVWNIETAIGYGLDVWGRILGTGRTVGNITLDDATYRNVLLAKAMANISNSSIFSINLILLQLFGPSSPTPVIGNPYVTDDGNMQMTITIGGPATFAGASASGTTLTVPSDPISGTIRVGQYISGTGIAGFPVVLSQLTGSAGLAGTYQLDTNETAGPETMQSHSPISATQSAIITYAGAIPKPAGVKLTVVN